MTTRIALAFTALLIPAAAQADPFCDTLKSIVEAGAEQTPFNSLNSQRPTPDLEMAATKNLPGFTCAISAEGRITFFACKQPNENGAAIQADLTKQATACLGGQATTTTDYWNDTVSEIPIAAKSATKMILRWSPKNKYVGAAVRVMIAK